MALDLLAIARSVIAIDSRSSVTNRPLVDLLAPLCAAAGLETTLLEESRDSVPQFDLLAIRHGAPHLAPLLLVTHLDTVPPGDPTLWTECGGDPLRLTERDERLFGLGTADVKLDFVCKLLALERLRDVPLERTVILAGTYGEETGRYGAQLLARRLRPLPGVALVGEPTSLRPCSAHKGYMEIHVSATHPVREPRPAPLWRLEFEGVAAHSSQPHRGRSAGDACLAAIAKPALARTLEILTVESGDLVNRVSTKASAVVAADAPPAVGATTVAPVDDYPVPGSSPELVTLLLAVHRSTGELREALQQHVVNGFDPPWSTVNNGLLRLGGGSLSHVVDVRRLVGEPPERAIAAHLERLEAALRECGCEAHVTTRLDSPPFRAASDSRAVAAVERALRALRMDTAHEHKSGTTEASVLAAVGVDTVVVGPGAAAGNIHRPNEHVPVADLRAAVDLYASVVQGLAAR